MAKVYAVKITEQARSQIQEILHYITTDLQAPDAALHLIDALEKSIASLSLFPCRIALTDEEPWHSCGIHRMPVKNFLVYFWVDENAAKVQVTAILYERCDQLQQLALMKMEELT